MKYKIFAFVSIVSIILLLGCLQNTPQENGTPSNGSTEPQTFQIAITSEGFSPDSLTINAGDTVVWTNNSAEESWPASAIHPTHQAYPGSDIEKCGTAEEENIFDSCKGLGQGESYSFTFNEKGKWFYHDHLQVNQTGSITVQ